MWHRAEGWFSPHAPFLPHCLPSPSLSVRYCLPSAKTRGWRERDGAWCWRRWGEWSQRGRDGRKKSENPFWNPFSIRGPQAVITGVPEWRPVSENVSYPFLKWNLIWEAQRWRGQRICKLLSIPAVNGNFISVRWHSPLFTVDHLNGCLKRRWPLTPLSPLALCIILPTRRFSFPFIQCRVKPFFLYFKHFNYTHSLVKGIYTQPTRKPNISRPLRLSVFASEKLDLVVLNTPPKVQRLTFHIKCRGFWIHTPIRNTLRIPNCYLCPV